MTVSVNTAFSNSCRGCEQNHEEIVRCAITGTLGYLGLAESICDCAQRPKHMCLANHTSSNLKAYGVS
jgi:hypothetical protein